jgi:phosphopantothenoylcysteine decarboxylase/phosphopantothenate--cysteine ligase
MNSNMLAHEAEQRNVQTLTARGVRFVEPGEGYLACGWVGRGRLAEPADIAAAADRMLAPASTSLGGRAVLVTAGPTYEDIDAVRYVGNRSSGRMGFALAAEARRRGARVTLVAGPTRIDPPEVDELVRVRSAAEMHDAVMRAAAAADVVIMAAAVADYTPAQPAVGKIAKTEGPMTLTLQRTPDILAELGAVRHDLASSRPLLVGFAAETGDVIARARAKLAGKKADLIVANDVSQPDRGFDATTNAVVMIDAAGQHPVHLQSKEGVAGHILDRIETLLHERAPAGARP